MRRRWYTRLTNSAIAKVKPRNFSTTETSNHPSRFYQQLYQLTIVKFLRLKFFDRFKHVRFLREGSFACLFICLFVFMILIKFIEDTRKNFEAKIMDYKTKVKPNEKKKRNTERLKKIWWWFVSSVVMHFCMFFLFLFFLFFFFGLCFQWWWLLLYGTGYIHHLFFVVIVVVVVWCNRCFFLLYPIVSTLFFFTSVIQLKLRQRISKKNCGKINS